MRDMLGHLPYTTGTMGRVPEDGAMVPGRVPMRRRVPAGSA